ncbi:MAG: acyl carrier protein [Clostridiales bacterium]|nr:acyl carrier protein [Clostridiales bacterium]
MPKQTETVERTVCQLLKLEGGEDGSVRLREDLGVDSLAMVDLVIDLEDRLGVEFNDADLDPSVLLTLDDLYQMIARRLSPAADDI